MDLGTVDPPYTASGRWPIVGGARSKARSQKEFEASHEPGEAWVATEHLQVRILPQPFPETVSQLEGALEGREGRVDHAEHGIATCKVVPGDGVIGHQADEPAVELESPRVFPIGGEVIGLDLDRLDVVRIAFQ